MPRETTKRKTNSKNPPPQDTRLPPWIWLCTGMVIGAFFMFLVKLNNVPPQPNETLAKRTDKSVEKTTPKQSPRFDFYDLLKENKVTVPDSPPSKTSSTGNLPKAAQNEEFILQVASFKSGDDAEKLRAELLLLNLEATTEEAKVRNGETWYRVLVGPFKSHSKLSKARNTLLSNHHEALVLKRARSA